MKSCTPGYERLRGKQINSHLSIFSQCVDPLGKVAFFKIQLNFALLKSEHIDHFLNI
jgi:hypothetical protein